MTHEIGIDSSLLAKIRDGVKTVECRLATPRFMAMRPGDTVWIREDVWQDGEIVKSIPKQLAVTITSVTRYGSFAEMLEHVDYRSAVPQAQTQAEALAEYRKFYREADERTYGVVAIGIELVAQ